MSTCLVIVYSMSKYKRCYGSCCVTFETLVLPCKCLIALLTIVEGLVIPFDFNKNDKFLLRSLDGSSFKGFILYLMELTALIFALYRIFEWLPRGFIPQS